MEIEQAGMTVMSSDSTDALRLLDCVREKVVESGIEVRINNPADGDHVLALAQNVFGLTALLDELLDQCAQDLDVANRREHLLVDPKRN
jgi:hypothetical protein